MYDQKYSHVRNLSRLSFAGALSSDSQILESMWDHEDDILTGMNNLDHCNID